MRATYENLIDLKSYMNIRNNILFLLLSVIIRNEWNFLTSLVVIILKAFKRGVNNAWRVF